MAKGAETPKINPQQLDVYLAQEHRSATSLLAASRVTGDETLLEEALRAQPADPRVALAALTRPGGAREGRHSLIVAFKKSAPDNSLPNYLAALEEFRAGQPNQAVRELGAAAKNPLQDYSADFVASSRAAYQAAGCSPADAATAAQLALPLPHLVQLKELAQAIVDLAVKYRQSGNSRGAQTLLQIGFELGQRLNSGSGTLVRDLVGIAIQRLMLGSLDPTAPFGASGQSVQNQLDALAHERDTLQALARQQEGIVGSLSDGEVVQYLEQVATTGERAAAQWVLTKYSPK